MIRWATPADVRSDWMIHLSAWIVQDGNYPDFRTGQEAEFALEFYSEKGLIPSVGDSSEINQALLVSDGEYQIRGEVVAMQDDAWVIDVGIMAFREERPPDWVRRGTKLKGRLEFGVDPFFYFERLGKRDAMPALIHTWEILQIRMQTAPFINPSDQLWIRDPNKLGWRQISSTNAWEDDEGNAEYVLRCRLLDRLTKRTSATAT